MKSLKLTILLINLIFIFSHATSGAAGATETHRSHVFLVKTDLTKEQVEELLKTVELNEFKQKEPTALKEEFKVEELKENITLISSSNCISRFSQ